MASSDPRKWYLNTKWLRSFLAKQSKAPEISPEQETERMSTPPATGRGTGHIDIDIDPSDTVSNVGGSEQETHQKQNTASKVDNALAERLSALIEDANSRVLPLTKMIRQHIDAMFSRPDTDRNEDELIGQVTPLLRQAELILNETHGAIRGADPDKRLSNRATRHVRSHEATPQEQRLAETMRVLVEDVGGTIEWARNKLDVFPKAKKDLAPLLDALGQPLAQIVGGVGMLLAGVLNLVASLLDGLGLGGLLRGLVGALGLDKIYGSLC